MLEPHGLKLVPVPMVQSVLNGCYVLFKANHSRGLRILISRSIRVLTDNDEKFHISRREHAALILDTELEAFKILPILNLSTSPSSLTDDADRLGGMKAVEGAQTDAAADEVEPQQSQTAAASAVAVETEATESVDKNEV